MENEKRLDLIDRQELIKAAQKKQFGIGDNTHPYKAVEIVGKYFRKVVDDAPTVDAVEIPKTGIGDLSDGYHTFNELYHHRAVLFSVICNMHPLCSWKARKHSDGTMFDGMFIVGINTPDGPATYHFDIDPYWDMFNVPSTEYAPEWDGHTPDEAIRRIGLLGRD